MKYTIEQIKQGDDELILRYQNLNQEVEHIINFMSFAERKTFVYLEEYKTCCTLILMK